MALDAQALAKKLHDALGQKTDGYGKPTPISNQTLNYAKGLVAALKAGVVSHLPGTVTGTCAPGAPLSGGAAAGGLMVLTPGPMQAVTGSGLEPVAVANIAKENTAIITYIMTGTVSFTSGITGTCTNTGESPGPLVSGSGSGGKIVGLTGAGASAAVSAALGGTGPEMLKRYTALVDYVLENAAVTYASGSVVGVCPPGGGGLTAGAASGGTIN